MRRDIVFLVRGIPDGFLMQDKGVFFMAPVETSFETLLRADAQKIPTLKLFLDEQPKAKLFCVGFRNDVPDETSAVEKAWKHLTGILDGFAWVVDGSLPDVCGLVHIREEDAEHAKLKIYDSAGWAHFHGRTEKSQTEWKERQAKLRDKLLVFSDLVAAGDPKYRNDLCYQLRYSAKIFRCGVESKSYGVEFLCKFSALEGLVCGTAKSGKERLLKTRLKWLFARSRRNVEHDVHALWELRCQASHQAKAFHDEDIPGSNPIQLSIVTIEYYLTGVFVFAVEHVGQVTTVDDLWSKQLRYSLPDYAVSERPHDMPKLPIVNFLVETRLWANKAGVIIDAVYAAQQNAAASRVAVDGNPKDERQEPPEGATSCGPFHQSDSHE